MRTSHSPSSEQHESGGVGGACQDEQDIERSAADGVEIGSNTPVDPCRRAKNACCSLRQMHTPVDPESMQKSAHTITSLPRNSAGGEGLRGRAVKKEQSLGRKVRGRAAPQGRSHPARLPNPLGFRADAQMANKVNETHPLPWGTHTPCGARACLITRSTKMEVVLVSTPR
jgi:hypothetical protein